jgi:hypothetical protein
MKFHWKARYSCWLFCCSTNMDFFFSLMKIIYQKLLVLCLRTNIFSSLIFRAHSVLSVQKAVNYEATIMDIIANAFIRLHHGRFRNSFKCVRMVEIVFRKPNISFSLHDLLWLLAFDGFGSWNRGRFELVQLPFSKRRKVQFQCGFLHQKQRSISHWLIPPLSHQITSRLRSPI